MSKCHMVKTDKEFLPCADIRIFCIPLVKEKVV
jgi:hypothetical protein